MKEHLFKFKVIIILVNIKVLVVTPFVRVCWFLLLLECVIVRWSALECVIVRYSADFSHTPKY